jgi:hypothetical protein
MPFLQQPVDHLAAHAAKTNESDVRHSSTCSCALTNYSTTMTGSGIAEAILYTREKY